MTDVARRLKAIGRGDRNTADIARPVRPGDISVPLLARHCDKPNAESEASLTAFVHADAERARERAFRRSASARSSTTLAALAQAHAALDEATDAIDTARDAIELSKATDPDLGDYWLDPSAVRIAVEILLRFHDAQYAYQALMHAPVTPALCLTFASSAVAVGKRTEAERVLAQYDNWAVNAYSGYLHVHFREFDKAVPRLQRSLAVEPNDADSLFNLAMAWWNLGCPDKALSAISQAAHIASGRKDITYLYFEFLLTTGELNRLLLEISKLYERKVVVDASLIEIRASTSYLQGDLTEAVNLFTAAAEFAKHEGNSSLERRCRSALARIVPLLSD